MSARQIIEMTPMAPERVEFLAMLQPPFKNLGYNVRMLLQGNFPEFKQFSSRLLRANDKGSALVLMLGEYGYGVPAQYTLKAWHELTFEAKQQLNELLQAELDTNWDMFTAEAGEPAA